MQRRLAMLESRRCGAKTRKGTPCRSPAMPAVAECMEANQQAHQRASFLAILVASAVRYFRIVSAGAGASFPGGGPAAMPSVLFINSLIASVFGGLAAHGLLAAASPPHPPVLTGAVAGLFGGVLMALLMICYYTARGEGFRGQR